MTDELTLNNSKNAMASLMKSMNTFPVLERKGDRRTSVESRILYVGIRESRRMLHIYFIIIFHISLVSFTSNLLPVFCIHLQMREANLPASYLLPISLFIEKRADVQSDSSLKGSLTSFRSVV